MLLKPRPPAIDPAPTKLRPGFEHLDPDAVAVLRWLAANKVDYVLVGPVAHAIRGDADARGPAAIVPAPYDRNFERLTRALVAEHAGLRSERGLTLSGQRSAAVTVKLTAEKLARGRRWMLSFGAYDLDLEGAGSHLTGAASDGPAAWGGRSGGERPVPASGPATSGPRYQELLYEATRVAIADGLAVEVASPEDLEHFSYVRRTGAAPEFRVTRNAPTVPEAPAHDESDPRAAGPPAEAERADQQATGPNDDPPAPAGGSAD